MWEFIKYCLYCLGIVISGSFGKTGVPSGIAYTVPVNLKFFKYSINSIRYSSKFGMIISIKTIITIKKKQLKKMLKHWEPVLP